MAASQFSPTLPICNNGTKNDGRLIEIVKDPESRGRNNELTTYSN